MDPARTIAFVSSAIDSSALPVLLDYVRVPSVSPGFDPAWQANGFIQQAQDVLLTWVHSQSVSGLTCELITHPNTPPVVYIEVPATTPGLPTVLIYGHMDKQPAFTGWSEFCGPYEPVVREGLLYGRGCVDDGYSITSAVLAVKAVQEQGLPHGKVVIVVENEEESGSDNLLANLETIKAKTGPVNLIVCLDSGGPDFNRLWVTSSLRGYVEFQLEVKVLDKGVHSGNSSGIVPSSFRIITQLLNRVEDQATGRILLPEMHTKLTTEQHDRTNALAQFAGDFLYQRFPFVPGAQPMTDDLTELLLNELLRPTLSVTGASGLPETSSAGNVLLPFTSLKLSFRTPPGVDENAALQKAIEVLVSDPPHGAHVTVLRAGAGKGWGLQPLSKWLKAALSSASKAVFGSEEMYCGEGGSIPLMRSLQDLYPEADFLVTGALGPQSNAHGPDENMNIAFYKNLTACIALILQAHSSS